MGRCNITQCDPEIFNILQALSCICENLLHCFLIIKTGNGALVVLSNVSAGKTQILLSVNSALRGGCFGIC